MSGRASTHPPIKTFFGCPACMNPNDLDARVAFLGVPYDGGTNPFTRSGSRTGPDSVRDQQTFQYAGDYFGPAPAMGVPSTGWYDIEEEKTYLEGVTMADAGDVAIAGGSTTIAFDTVTRVVEQLAATDAVVAAVGGDHSVAFPVGRGMGRYDEIDIVHIDAHADFSDEVNGSRFSHGSNLRRLSELPFVRNITVLGIRKATRESHEALLDHGATVLTTKDLLDERPADVIARRMPPSRNLYVSLDTDVLDAAIVPGTTVPEPFGLPYRALREVLVAVARKGQIRGFDVVEMGALDGIAAPRTTAWLITHLLSAIFDEED